MTAIPRGDSLASALMTGVTLYRNKPGIFNKIEAQLGYALVFVVAVVEAIAATALTLLSLLALPISHKPYDGSIKLVKSAAFTIAWSFFDFLINPFVLVAAADEQSARHIASSRTWLLLPVPQKGVGDTPSVRQALT